MIMQIHLHYLAERVAAAWLRKGELRLSR